LGVKFDSLVYRWRENKPSQNVMETQGRMQFNALLIDVDEQTGLSRRATHLRKIL
jgi:calcineurin-like phosphoesterase